LDWELSSQRVKSETLRRKRTIKAKGKGRGYSLPFPGGGVGWQKGRFGKVLLQKHKE